MAPHTERVYSRLGLLGNPSDGMRGAAIAVSLENFYATVTIEPSERIRITPHALHDACSFESLQHLCENTDAFGYHGGHRLLLVCSCELCFSYAQAIGCALGSAMHGAMHWYHTQQ
jgi:glucuronokinase